MDGSIRRMYFANRHFPSRGARENGFPVRPQIRAARSPGAFLCRPDAIRRGAWQAESLQRNNHMGILATHSRTARSGKIRADVGGIRGEQCGSAALGRKYPEKILPPGIVNLGTRQKRLSFSRQAVAWR